MTEKVALTLFKANTMATPGMPESSANPIKKTEVSIEEELSSKNADDSPVVISDKKEDTISSDPKLAEYGIDLNKPFTVTKEMIQKMKNKGKKGFWESLKDGAKNAIPFISGAMEIKKSVELLAIANKQKNGEKLTKDETEKLYSYLLEQVENEYRESSFMGKVGDMLSHLPAFAGEFALTGGLYSAGNKVALKASQKILGHVVKKQIAKTFIKKAGAVAVGSAFRTVALSNTYAGIVQRRTEIDRNGLKQEVLEDGTIVSTGELNIKKSDESVGTSIAKGLADGYIESLSEQSGQALIKPLSKMPFGKYLTPAKSSQKFLNKIGYHGLLEEYAEERFGGFLRGAIALDKPQDKGYIENLYDSTVPTLEQSGVELTTTALWGGTMTASHKAYQVQQSINSHKAFKQYINQTKQLLEDESKKFYSQTQEIRKITNFEENKAILENLLNQSAHEWEYSEGTYAKLVNAILQNGLENSFTPDKTSSQEVKKLYQRIKRDINFQWDNAQKIYYSQEGMLNPNLAEIKSSISDRKLPLFDKKQFCYSSLSHLKKDLNHKIGNFNVLDETVKMLHESEELTLDSGSLMQDTYTRDTFYDFPFKFASAAYNSLAQKGNAYIEMAVPEIFQGLNKSEIYESLDLLSTHLRGYSTTSFPEGSVVKFQIGNKEFSCESLGHGQEGVVFKLSSADNAKPVILKVYYPCSDYYYGNVGFSPAGLYGGLGILREANLAKVTDVPDLYMANPIYKPIKGGKSPYLGAWQIVEDASTKEVKDGLKFQDWIKQKGLSWNDNKDDAWINNVCVDTGFVMQGASRDIFGGKGWGHWGLHELYSKYLNGETTSQILEELMNAE